MLVKAFDAMLSRHGLADKVCTAMWISGPWLTTYANYILAVNADNVISNDRMITDLDDMPNAFDEVNRVRCFNHTLQLSAKTLIRPFNAGLSSSKVGDVDDVDSDDNGDGDGEEGDGEEGDGEEDSGDDQEGPKDYAEDDADVLADLDPYERAALMEDTATVRAVVTKVHLTPSHTALTMNSITGLKTCLCNHSLNDNCAAGLASCLQRSSHETKTDSL